LSLPVAQLQLKRNDFSNPLIGKEHSDALRAAAPILIEEELVKPGTDLSRTIAALIDPGLRKASLAGPDRHAATGSFIAAAECRYGTGGGQRSATGSATLAMALAHRRTAAGAGAAGTGGGRQTRTDSVTSVSAAQ